MNKEIVIVGGGPVGLWTATQIKKRNPGAVITIYERYQEYKRSHVLKLENSSLLLYAKTKRDNAQRAFMKDVLGGTLKQAFTGALKKGSVFIRTNDLECALKNYAAELGIKVTYQKIESADELMQRHPNCSDFIAADGAHSTLRQEIMGDEAVKNYPLQYVVELKYEAEGAAGKLSTEETYKTNKLMSNMCFEYVGKEKQGKTPVSLRFFIDEETYNQMPEASFKQPLNLNSPGLPEKLRQDIETYLQARQHIAGETLRNNSDKLSKLTLSLYRAKHFAEEHQGRNWYLVGDAAMGVPYFRSLNAGMIMGSQLGGIVTKNRWSDKSKRAAYNALTPLDAAWEFTAASSKNLALKGYDAFRKISASVPWEFMKWDSEEKQKFKKPGPR